MPFEDVVRVAGVDDLVVGIAIAVGMMMKPKLTVSVVLTWIDEDIKSEQKADSQVRKNESHEKAFVATTEARTRVGPVQYLLSRLPAVTDCIAFSR